MRLVERHIIKPSHVYYKQLLNLCHKSKNVYNAALYIVRQHFFECPKNSDIKHSYLNYYRVYTKMKNEHNPDFYTICSNAAQYTLKIVDQNFKSFFKLLKLKQSGKYKEDIKIPGYLPKDGYFTFGVNCINCSQPLKATGILKIPNTGIEIKSTHASTAKQLRIVPKPGYIVVEIVYNATEKELKADNQRYMSVDLGINNLCTVTSNVAKAFIVDGKAVKHVNQYWNKTTAKLKSKLPTGVYTSKLISNKTRKRKCFIDTYFHKVSRILINQAVDNQINTIIIGKNNGWKQEVKMQKESKQTFVQIPFNDLSSKIMYKAQLEGINIVIQEESYTSKASFLDNDPIPTYKPNDNTVYKFSGTRKHRGLYKSRKGLLNADVNGSLNIMRKALKCNSDDLFSPVDAGLFVSPCRIYIH